MADPAGQKTAAAANRAMSDEAFANEVLSGDEYPAVKAALLADLTEASESADTQGFAFESMAKPSPQLVSSYFQLQTSAQFANLKGLSDRAMRW